MSLTMKELRKALKGVPATADVSCGNSTSYSPNHENVKVLNIDLYTGEYDTKDNTKITDVIFWCPE